jgi:hypothetical protein
VGIHCQSTNRNINLESFDQKEVILSYAHEKQPRAQNKEQQHGDLTP